MAAFAIHIPYISHRCPGDVPTLIKLRHLWDIYGTSMGYPCLWLAFTIAENGIVIFGICVFHQFPHLLFLALKQGYFACIILQIVEMPG